MSRTFEVSPLDVAALRQGMFALASEPTWALAMKVLDRIEGAACSTMSGPEAQAWMAIVMAPMGLKAAELTIGLLRSEVSMLREDRTQLAQDLAELKAEKKRLEAVLLGRTA